MQVDDRVKQQRQHTLTATQSATAATYISKEAAHEVERVALQVRQLAAAAGVSSSSTDAAAGGASHNDDASSSPGEVTAVPAESMQQMKQQLEQEVQQWQQQHAEQQQGQDIKLTQLEHQLTQQQQSVAAAAAAHMQQIEGIAAAQQEVQQAVQQQAAASEQHQLQMTQLHQQCEEQQSHLVALQQQLQQHEALVQQWQTQAEQLQQLKQQLLQHEEQLAGAAAASSLAQDQRQQLDHMQQELTQIQVTCRQHAAAADTVSDTREQLLTLQDKLQQRDQQADELSSLVFSMRVEVQNDLQDLGKRLAAVEGVREDLDIWEASRKAAASRTEAAAAEALEKVGCRHHLAAAVCTRYCCCFVFHLSLCGQAMQAQSCQLAGGYQHAPSTTAYSAIKQCVYMHSGHGASSELSCKDVLSAPHTLLTPAGGGHDGVTC